MRRTTQEMYAYSCLDAAVATLRDVIADYPCPELPGLAHSLGDVLQLLKIVGEILTDPALDR